MTDTGLFTDLLNEALENPAYILTAIALLAITLIVATDPRGPGLP